jgi:hypothetical protein
VKRLDAVLRTKGAVDEFASVLSHEGQHFGVQVLAPSLRSFLSGQLTLVLVALRGHRFVVALLLSCDLRRGYGPPAYGTRASTTDLTRIALDVEQSLGPESLGSAPLQCT